MDELLKWRFDHPPKRSDDMPFSDVWMWFDTVGYWVEVTLRTNGSDPNAGGSPSPVGDTLEEDKGKPVEEEQ